MTTEHPTAESDVPRRPGRPRDAHYDEVILRTALRILLQEGYAGLTIEGVAAEAGVGRPTIYRRWPSKTALVVAALVRSTQIALPEVDTGSLRGDLVALQRRQVELMSAPMSRRVTAGLVADLTTDPELAAGYIEQYLAPRRELVFRVLQRGVDRGELAPDADLAFIYDLLIGPLFMRSVVWGEPLATDAAERTADVVLAAFGLR